MTGSLQQLLKQQTEINQALLSRLAETMPETESPVGTVSLLDERLENDRLVEVLRTQGLAAWKTEHKAVMRARREKLRIPLSSRSHRRLSGPNR